MKSDCADAFKQFLSDGGINAQSNLKTVLIFFDRDTELQAARQLNKLGVKTTLVASRTLVYGGCSPSRDAALL